MAAVGRLTSAARCWARRVASMVGQLLPIQGMPSAVAVRMTAGLRCPGLRRVPPRLSPGQRCNRGVPASSRLLLPPKGLLLGLGLVASLLAMQAASPPSVSASSLPITSGFEPAAIATMAQVGDGHPTAPGETGGSAPHSRSVSDGARTAAISLNTPTPASADTLEGPGTSTFQVPVSDRPGPSGILAENLRVAGAPSTALSITTTLLPAAKVGVPYRADLAAQGGEPPYTWSLCQRCLLPPGLTLTPTGVISGTPTHVELGGFLAQVTDSSSPGVAVRGSLFIYVLPATGYSTLQTVSTTGLSMPTGVALDAAGNIYVANDSNGGGVYEVSAAAHSQFGVGMSAGETYLVAGRGPGCDPQTDNFDSGCPALRASLVGPNGVAVDGAGNLYIAAAYDVVELAASTHEQFGIAMKAGYTYRIAGALPGSATGCAGQLDALGDGCPATRGVLNETRSVAVDGQGNVYVADTGDSVIREIAGTTHVQFGVSMVEGAIYSVAGDGKAGYAGDGGPASGAELNHPYGVAVDGAGNLYVADTRNSRIREVAATNHVQFGTSMQADHVYTIAGNGGYVGDACGTGPAPTLSVNSPLGVAVDPSDNVYVAANMVVQELAATSHAQFGLQMVANNLYTIAGTGALPAAGLSPFPGSGALGTEGGAGIATAVDAPASVAIAASGALYIADDAALETPGASSKLLKLTPGTASTDWVLVGYPPVPDTGGATATWGLLVLGVTAAPVITIAAPPGTIFPEHTSDYSMFGQTPTTVSGGGSNVVQISMSPNWYPSHPAWWPLHLKNVTNPPAGSYPAGDFTVSTCQSVSAPWGAGLDHFAAAPSPLILQVPSGSALQAAAVAHAYTATLRATGGTPPYTWSVIGGALPAGLSLDASTGVISGTPTTSGTSALTVQVTDSSSPVQTSTAHLSITVAPAGTSSADTVSATLSPEVSPAAAGQAGLEVAIPQIVDTSTGQAATGEDVAGYQLTLTAADPSAVHFLGVYCPSAFATCASHIDPSTGTVTISAANTQGAATPADLAFVALRVTGPVTAIESVRLTFQSIVDQHDTALGTPAPLAVALQRGAVFNACVNGAPASGAQTLSVGDAVAALQYLVGLRAAGTGCGQVNPVNLASLVPDGASGPSTPGVANVVALLQYLVGLRGPNLNLR